MATTLLLIVVLVVEFSQLWILFRSWKTNKNKKQEETEIEYQVRPVLKNRKQIQDVLDDFANRGFILVNILDGGTDKMIGDSYLYLFFIKKESKEL